MDDMISRAAVLRLLDENGVVFRGDADEMYGNWWYTCSVCHEQIDRGDKYCRWCGRAVKWA